jgi:hypothetical protein
MFPNKHLRSYDISLYLDGNIRIVKKLDNLISRALQNSLIAAPKHRKKDCIYEEAKDLKKRLNHKIKNKDKINNQIKKYKQEGFPKLYGMTENNILIRRHNRKKVVKLMEEWWKEYKKYSCRDQMSFMYLVWKNDIDIKILHEHANDNKFFQKYSHKKEYLITEHILRQVCRTTGNAELAKKMYKAIEKPKKLERRVRRWKECAHLRAFEKLRY